MQKRAPSQPYLAETITSTCRLLGFCRRHSHGAEGLASSHRPRPALLASRSACARSASFEYRRKPQATPSRTKFKAHVRLTDEDSAYGATIAIEASLLDAHVAVKDEL